ncbi:MAG: ATP-binding protein, partial [Chloroflexota bacterium]
RLLAGTAAAIARGERPSVPAVAAGAEVRQLAIAMQVMSRAVAEREAHLREETATLETINRLGQLLAAELDLPRLVQAVTDAATELAGARFGAFFYSVVDERGETRTLHTLSGVSRDAFAGFPMPRNTAIFGPTFRGESVIRLQDVRQDLRYGQNAPHGGLPSGHLPVASYLAVPVVARSGDVLGGLFFGHPQPGVFTERSERIVVGLAAQAAVAMDNARLYQQAQDAIRLRDEFLSVASHELKTPLTVLRGFAQLALRQLQQKRLDPDRIGRVLERFDEQTRKLDQLVTQLLDVSRLEAGKLTLERADTDVTALVEGVIEATQASTSRHTILLRAPAEGVLQAMVDGLRLEQVVLNLLSNAVKFSPDGGRIEVELTCVSNVASGPSDRADELDGDVLRLTVRDYGVGVAPEHRARIFERFYQASAEGQPAGRGRTGSMGLGLFICRQIVELHGGHIGAEFPADGGTRFVVTLPRSTGAHAGA